MSGIMLQQFANGLRNRSEETRTKAAKDLQHYVTTELREVSAGVGGTGLLTFPAFQIIRPWDSNVENM